MKTYAEMTTTDGPADKWKKGRMREYNQQVTTALLVQVSFSNNNKKI
jgi:hypothetical protein